MAWDERINPTIDFISPQGDKFSAYWAGDSRDVDKKLGVFRYPKFNGAVIQDMGLDAYTYPITFYFEGDDNDLDAEKFMTSAAQVGPWTVYHPTKGAKALQLVSISEDIQPISSGNITQLSSKWIETTDKPVAKSPAQIAADIDDQVDNVAKVAAAQYQVKTNKFSKLMALKNSVMSAIGAVRSALGKIMKVIADVNAAVNSIVGGIQAALDTFIFEPLEIAAQLFELIHLPSLIVGDFSSRLNAYKKLAESILGMGGSGSSDRDYNVSRTKELALCAVSAAVATIAASSTFKTRSEVISAVNSITDLFDSIVNGLDSDQEKFSGNSIDHQYFSQTESFNETLKIITMAVSLLIENIPNLKVEKRIILDRTRHTVELAASLYGGFGQNDENIDYFISTNNLTGLDVLVLPAGREVVVYV
jgi:prophage DNA circulation protein